MMKNSLLKTLLLLLLRPISYLNQYIPKSERRILFFNALKGSNDNNLALLEYLVRYKYNDYYTIFYASPDCHAIKQSNVYTITVLKALFIFLTAKYVFYDEGTIKIRPSKKQVVVQQWHGTPLKKLGRSVEHFSRYDRFNDFSWIITTSKHCVDIFAECFECPKSYVHVLGYPRNDYLFMPDRKALHSICQREYKKNILWMPTFRKSFRTAKNNEMGGNITSLPLFPSFADLEYLNCILLEKDFFLVIKLHPFSADNAMRFPLLSNIRILTNELYHDMHVINYSFVANFDVLITDYSSVYFDWLLLDRPIAFIVEDISSYMKNRGFTFENPLEYMPGEIIQNRQQFYDFLEHITQGKDDFVEFRHKIRDFAHTKIRDASACEKLLEFVGIRK